MKLRIALSLSLVACGSIAPAVGTDAAVQPDAQSVQDASIEATVEASTAPLADMATPRSLFGAVTGTDGHVRAFAGLSELGLVSSVEAYDAPTNTWTSGTLGKVHRYAHTVARAASGDVFVIGGTSDGQTPISSVEIYSPSTNTWSTAPDLPTPRLGLAAATATDGRIFAIGGGIPGAPTTVVEVYSPASKSWTTGPALPTARLSLQAVTGNDGLIYAIAGRDASATPLDVVEVLDPASGIWSTAPSLSTARYWFGAALAPDGRIFVVGGIGESGFTTSVEALTLGTGWSSVASLPEARAWLGAAFGSDGRLLAIGGSTDTGGQPPPLASMFAYEPSSNHWSP